jgi:hypothetical protein
LIATVPYFVDVGTVAVRAFFTEAKWASGMLQLDDCVESDDRALFRAQSFTGIDFDVSKEVRANDTGVSVSLRASSWCDMVDPCSFFALKTLGKKTPAYFIEKLGVLTMRLETSINMAFCPNGFGVTSHKK